MELGTALLWLCLAVNIAAVIGYIAGAIDKRNLAFARLAYYAMTTGVILTSVYLFDLILRHDFTSQYVHSNVSTDLPLIYLISAFWAGQEGSVLLWALFTAVIGLVLAAKAGDYEPWAMAFWNTVLCFLFVVLLAQSPFARTSSEALARFPNGQGLNPLLENFWIAIHPPMLFVGYAAMTVPAAFVVAGLIRKDYSNWSNRCLPWALFGWLTLGAGIILGSYWAYEVLGWGGYWGWDPIENASLVPWIAATALVHGMLVERYRGSMRKTNIALALLSFLLIIYATYLTRSGVLGDFSVHSFAPSGTSAYLVSFLGFFTLLSITLYLWRGKASPSKSWYGVIVSKEFAFFIGIIAFAALALLVLWGTSSPVVTIHAAWLAKLIDSNIIHTDFLSRLASVRPTAVRTSYYGLVSSPVAVVILILLVMAPLLPWARRQENRRISVGLGIIAGAICLALLAALSVLLVFNLGEAVLVAVALLAVLALAVNAYAAFKNGKGNWRALGGYMAHVGVALMFIAIVFCPSSQKSGHHIEITQGGAPVNYLGYKFSFLGPKEGPKGEQILRLKVEKNGRSFTATPTMRRTNQGLMSLPYIRWSPLSDLYISPKELKMPEIEPMLTSTPDGMRFTNAKTDDGGATVQLMKIQVEGQLAVVLIRMKDHPPVAVQFVKGETKRIEKYNFKFLGFHVPESHAMSGSMQVGGRFQVDAPGSKSIAVVEVSRKKLISLLWLGSMLALLGGGIAIARRVGENRKILDSSTESEE